MKTLRIIATMALMMALSAPAALASTPARHNSSTPARHNTITRQQQKQTSIVYVTKRGKCFHKASCTKLGIRRSKGMKRYQAEKAGYRPCKRCIDQ